MAQSHTSGRTTSQGADHLRSSLGDWRDAEPIALPKPTGIASRTELYVQRGLDPDLTDFPEEAFEESLDALEIRVGAPPLLAVYDPPVSMDDPELRAGLDRNSMAQSWLQAFETQFRRFIDERMSAAYGADWPRSKLPNNMFGRWVEKRDKDPNRDRHPRLIAYADFTDYELVVTKADNFREVFAMYFGRPERFRESMARLALPRVEISHARIITQDDALFFWVELRRLSTQFGRSS